MPPDPPASPAGWAPPPPAESAPPPGWPPQATPGDWSAPGYGDWGPPHRNGLGTASLVLGVLSVPAALTIVPGFFLGLVALVLGLLARGRVKRREATNGGVATAGTILGALGLTATIVWVAVLTIATYNEQRHYDDCLRGGTAENVCSERYLD